MSVIEFRPYKKLEDIELLDRVYYKMIKLRNMSNEEDFNKYWKEAIEFNNMLIEIKKRSLEIDKKELVERILF